MSDNMNTAIDVTYPKQPPLESKSIEQLRAEIDTNFRQAGALSSLMIEALVRAGDRLIEVKRRMKHGEFMEWCNKELPCSYSKAVKMMKLSRKVHDDKSIFSRFDQFKNVGVSRMWVLIDSPEWCVQQLIAERRVTDFAVRDLRKELNAIKRRNKPCQIA